MDFFLFDLSRTDFDLLWHIFNEWPRVSHNFFQQRVVEFSQTMKENSKNVFHQRHQRWSAPSFFGFTTLYTYVAYVTAYDGPSLMNIVNIVHGKHTNKGKKVLFFYTFVWFIFKLILFIFTAQDAPHTLQNTKGKRGNWKNLFIFCKPEKPTTTTTKKGPENIWFAWIWEKEWKSFKSFLCKN